MPENYTFRDLLRKRDEDLDRIGRASYRNIDKTGVFYHVITKSARGDNVFLAKGAGDYRHDLLCRLCEERGIILVFSTTMPSHSHDVLLTPDWETLCGVYKILNTNVSKFIRKQNPDKYPAGERILRRHPVYIAVRDMVYLCILGKYIFDNPEYLRKESRFIPHDCFWMFQKSHFSSAYDETLYKKLFGLEPRQLYDLYSSSSMPQIRQFAVEKYGSWPASQTRSLFYRE